jgi:hypothetical protein
MPAPSFDDPQHWRKRAEKARTIADQMNDPRAKASMLLIAEDCDHLAERAAARAKH